MRTRSNSQQGTALIVSFAVVIGLSALAGTYLTASYNGYEMNARETDAVRARIAADEGLHRAAAELRRQIDADNDGLGNIEFTGDDGRQIAVTATDLGGGLFRLHSVGTLPRAALAADMLIQVEPPSNLNVNLRAAITAEGAVTTLGNIEIDGRDWDYAGSAVIGGGVFGISSVDWVFNGGSSMVGGNGVAPAKAKKKTPISPLAQESYASWADGLDQDGDGSADEESLDGIDNDGDGLVDEDTSDFPQNPDAVLGVPPGSLLAAAQARGTYFTSESALNSWISANSGNVPGGQIIYCDFPKWLPADFGGIMNDPPSIFVHHGSLGDNQMKNVHGAFGGLIIADKVMHLNGNFSLMGGLISLADEKYGNAFGNGNAHVRYSSTSVANLPSTGGLSKITVVSWSRSSAN